MLEAITRVLQQTPDVGYALVFGSVGRGDARADSDLDVAIGGKSTPFTVLQLGDVISRLEAASGRTVDLVDLDDAPPGISYRVFRDGLVVLNRRPEQFRERKARAVLEYLDWQPVEELFARSGRPGRG